MWVSISEFKRLRARVELIESNESWKQLFKLELRIEQLERKVKNLNLLGEEV